MTNLTQKEILLKLEEEIIKISADDKPAELYEPIQYIMSLGGKRLRPVLVLLAYQLYKSDTENAINPAIGVELFHNFSLMHDDIMDNAPLRRGKQTVHEKWNTNIAILSGDVMLVKAYDYLLNCEKDVLKEVLIAFNKAATEVCEGQQWDMNFEKLTTVSVAQYIDMIRQKTAVLLGFSLQLGAILGNAGADEKELLYNLGVNAGIAFQLKDDLLDAFGDSAKFGKQVGGDIISNKKTYLLITALQKADASTLSELNKWLSASVFDKTEKVNAVLSIYEKLGIKEATESKIKEYYTMALKDLETLKNKGLATVDLTAFLDELMNREK
jgi:geranylgeranyl diphosphate synthase, type II